MRPKPGEILGYLDWPLIRGENFHYQWLPVPTVDPLIPYPGRLRTLGSDGAGYCLTSPRSTVATLYVTLTSCTATGPLTDAQTSVVYGIAQRIARRDEVSSLDDRIIVEIPISELIAGTQVRGSLAEGEKTGFGIVGEIIGADNVNTPASAWVLQIVLSCLDHLTILGEVERVEGTDPQRWALR